MSFITDHFVLFLGIGLQLWIQVVRAETIGSDVRLPLTRSFEDRFYLNTARPALCNGTITTVNYCYYGVDNTRLSRVSYESLVAIYRPTNDNQNFIKVSETITLRKRTPLNEVAPSEALLPGFNCDSYMLSESTQVLIGDVIGVCFHNPNGQERQPLDLVSRDDNGYSLLSDRTTDVKCDIGVMPSGVRLNRLRTADNPRILHISANISGIAATTTEEPPTATEATFTASSSDALALSTTTIGVIVGVGLLGILVLAIIVINVLALVRRSMKKRRRLNLVKTIPRGNSSSSLVRHHNEEDDGDGGDRYSTHNFSCTYTNAISTFPSQTRLQTEATAYQTSRDGNLKTGTQYSHYEMQDSSLWHDYHFYFTLEGPNCTYDKLLEKNRSEDIYANVTPYAEPAWKTSDLYAQIKSCGIRNIDRRSIQISGHLGSGQFGSVELGVLKSETHEVKVALKTSNQGTSEENMIKFLQEGAIMAQFRHPNVILLYGIVSKDEPVTMVTEFVEKGDLQQYLLTLRPKTNELPAPHLPALLLQFSQHVALGMQYLSGKGFVHRDLAARNILVSRNNICKIADFGLSRDLANEKYYISKGGLIPIKWTAPEAITYKKYSTASDVWSYGCLLYEIWSLGHKPYSSLSNTESVRFVSKGKRLSPPPGCPRAIYEFMINCWNPTTTGRPNFRALYLSLNENARNVLYIPQMDLATHQYAGVLGHPPEVGEGMYLELQKKYEDASYYDDII